METIVSSAKKEVVISDQGPTIIIGERLNPTGKPGMCAALKEENFAYLQAQAISQVEAGAEILDINVVFRGVDEVRLLPKVVRAVTEVVDVPLCLDFNDPRALESALEAYKGRPIINSVTGEATSLKTILPFVKQFDATVIGLTVDEEGIPKDSEKRLDIAVRIVESALAMGIPRHSVILDCLVLSAAADARAAIITLESVRKVREKLGNNQTLGASNVSFGLPDRGIITNAFLAMAIQLGITCPTADAEKVRSTVLAVDLLMGRDRFARRYLSAFRKSHRAIK